MRVLSKSQKKIFKIAILLAITAIFLFLFLLSESDARRDFAIFTTINEWAAEYENIDKIVFQHEGQITEISYSDVDFAHVMATLNPFGNPRISGIEGNRMINLSDFEVAALVSYYIGGVQLFYVAIHLIPEGTDLSSTERRVFLFEGSRAIVTLDSSGWFGSFRDSRLYLSDVFQ